MRKIRHPIALLRFLLGKTQAQFGVAIGVTADYIKKVELGDRKLSREKWHTILNLYGWYTQELNMPLPDPGDAAAWGRLIALHWLELDGWKHREPFFNNDAQAAFSELFTPAIVELIVKAQRKNRAIALLLSLENWLTEAVENFGLGKLWMGNSMTPGIYSWGTGLKTATTGEISPPRATTLAPDHIRRATAPWLKTLPPAQAERWAGILWSESPADTVTPPAKVKVKGKGVPRRASRKPRRA